MRILWTLVAWLSLGTLGSAASVTMAWEASPTAAGYRVLVGPASRTYTTTIDVGNVLQATVPDLVPGQVYYFAVIAYTGALVSLYSNEISREMPPDVDPACTPPLGSQSIAIFPTALQKTGSGGAGSNARLDFQLASASPITHVAVRTKGANLETMDGANLTKLAGVWFRLPSMAETYPLSILASNAYGCTREVLTPRTVTIP